MTKKKTFEGALSELQDIIEKLESGSPSLDEMIKLYENGIKIMAFCKKQLDGVELRISTISEKNGIEKKW